ncbi:DNA replication and repair protein RadC [Desulfotomaculum arcticum]|uniref:DNA replication and repair protein RadC n=2 Tax=Desulfotruncus TaxID=2867377 RepID=A0A1I2UNJ6_9FIRM|nr:DNA replication and repair protein RadC [Desulfotomaculum arcticum] [Desulfotruncus arcticus DSM 17038]
MITQDYRVTIKEMPVELRPRERLLKEGPQLLSDIELLAIMLRTGSTGLSAVELATVLLGRFGGLKQLLDVSTEELSEFKGMGPAKVAQIRAALELGRRVAMATAWDRPTIKSPENAAALVMEEMRHLDREHFWALLLNTKNQVLSREIVSIGTLNSSAIHPRELYKAAIRRSAAGVILVHNHPSGDPTPSQQDIDVTKRLIEAGNIIGINVLDHLVIGDNKFVSFKARGLM